MESKPFGVVLRETREKLVQVLNDSGLPIDAMAMLLDKLFATVTAQAEQEYQSELAKMKEPVEEHEGTD